ncbi:hypothetical protein [Cellulomonas taurus]|jgi:hypothetical protein|uniref:hypothetical protein n=1 Tax=Cellulomonas taurus TaxID=2729175 RepID=UPI00145F0202|nr:hypothetical protein [Cellulomonas taurus]
MSDLSLDLEAARSAQSALHRVSGGLRLDLRQWVPNAGATRVHTALDAWVSWIAQDSTTLSARVWADGDAVRDAAAALIDADRQLATAGVAAAR